MVLGTLRDSTGPPRRMGKREREILSLAAGERHTFFGLAWTSCVERSGALSFTFSHPEPLDAGPLCLGVGGCGHELFGTG